MDPFTIFRMLKPFFTKTTLYIVLIAGLVASAFFTYNYISKKFEALDQANLTISKQADVIKDLGIEISKLRESNEATIKALETLQAKQSEIKLAAKQKVIVIHDKVKQIETSDLPQAEKDTEISTVYLDGLYENYCSIHSSNCL